MRAISKYGAFFRVGVVRGITERGELYGRLLFVPVILGVFTALWGAVGEGGARVDAAPHALVWYLAITEWIAMSAPLIYQEIQEDIVRGDIATQLPRPVSYLGAVFCQALGLMSVRALAIGLTAGVCAYLWTGEVPAWQVLAHAVPLGLAAAILIVAMYVGIGVTAFWFADVTPLYWIWQKALFILGGLMLPLELYPTWLQHLAVLTPFPSLLSGPAGFVLHPEALQAPQAVTTWVVRLVVWLALVAGVSQVLYQRALQRLQLNGG